MPNNQTIEFPYFPGSGDMDFFLYSLGASGAAIASVTATESNDRSGIYTAMVVDVPAGIYRFQAHLDGDVESAYTDTITLDAATGVYVGSSELAGVALQSTATAINNKLPADTATKIALIEAMRGTDGAATPSQVATALMTHLPTLVAAVDEGLLNAGDATDLIASIVARIGNTNVDEVSLVGLIRADIERSGGMLASIDLDAVSQQVFALGAAISSINPLTASETEQVVDTALGAYSLDTVSQELAGLINRASEARLAKLDRDVAAVGDGMDLVDKTKGLLESTLKSGVEYDHNVASVQSAQDPKTGETARTTFSEVTPTVQPG